MCGRIYRPKHDVCSRVILISAEEKRSGSVSRPRPLVTGVPSTCRLHGGRRLSFSAQTRDFWMLRLLPPMRDRGRWRYRVSLTLLPVVTLHSRHNFVQQLWARSRLSTWLGNQLDELHVCENATVSLQDICALFCLLIYVLFFRTFSIILDT